MRRSMFIVVVIMMMALSAPAFAAKGGQGKGGNGNKGGGKTVDANISLVLAADSDGDGMVSHGDDITFDVSTTATSEPNVNVSCTQNGVVVYGATTGYYEDYPWPWTQVMTLSSGMWSGGAADCTATLNYYQRTRVIELTSMNFTVGG